MSALQGYRTQQKSGQPQYQTLQQVGRAGGGSYATDTVQKVLFEASTVDDAVEAGSTKSVITATAHQALPGDMVRFLPSSANPSVEVGVISVTANTITLAGDLPAVPLVADLFKVMRWITPLADANGSPLSTSGPVSFELDAVITNVTKDTVTPANTVGLPVQIVGANGVDINITAGDINVQTSASGPNFDSMRIGDGTNLMAVNASLEATVVDAGANTKLTSIDGKVLTDTQLRATPVAVSGPLTDTQLRATAVPVSGPLTDVQLRAVAVPVSLAASPLPTGAATEAKQDVGNTSLGSIDTKTPALVTGRVPVDGSGVTQPISAAALPLPTGAATEAKQDTQITSLGTIVTQTAGLALETTQAAGNVLIGAVTETAPASDTASSGLNGRLQRIAQRLTSLLALFPSSIGQKASADSLSVVLSSDSAAIAPASVAGTITSAQITVDTTAVRATVSGAAPSAIRKRLSIKPSIDNTGRIFIGASGVTTANGLEIVGPDRLDFEFDSGDYYLISDSSLQSVDILEKV